MDRHEDFVKMALTVLGLLWRAADEAVPGDATSHDQVAALHMHHIIEAVGFILIDHGMYMPKDAVIDMVSSTVAVVEDYSDLSREAAAQHRDYLAALNDERTPEHWPDDTEWRLRNYFRSVMYVYEDEDVAFI